MVEHNSKWDRRAKARYLKKHNLKPSDVSKAAKQSNLAQPDNHAAEDSPSVEEGNETQGGSIESEIDANENDTYDTGAPYEVIEQPYLPDLADENEEETKIIRDQFNHSIETNDRFKDKPHIKIVDKSEFTRANENVEQSNMNRDVRNRLGRRVANTAIEVDSDDDFDSFMDSLNAREPSVNEATNPIRQVSESTVEKSKQDFVDSLLK